MSCFASYDGTEIEFRTLGDGRPLMCLPGGPGRACEYLGGLGGLACSRKLILPDTRGTGASADADPATYRCDRLVGDVEALRAHLGLSRMDLLGHSAAGDLAELYAAATLAAAGRARWCLTLVDPRGRAVAHGCARAGPGTPGTNRAAWLASVKITTIESGTCAHPRESAGYRPSPTLRHIVKVRSPRCGYPGCGRQAQRCDDDHTIPHHNGGKTCECNLYLPCLR